MAECPLDRGGGGVDDGGPVKTTRGGQEKDRYSTHPPRTLYTSRRTFTLRTLHSGLSPAAAAISLFRTAGAARTENATPHVRETPLTTSDDFFYWGRRCWMKGLIYTAGWCGGKEAIGKKGNNTLAD